MERTKGLADSDSWLEYKLLLPFDDFLLLLTEVEEPGRGNSGSGRPEMLIPLRLLSLTLSDDSILPFIEVRMTAVGCCCRDWGGLILTWSELLLLLSTPTVILAPPWCRLARARRSSELNLLKAGGWWWPGPPGWLCDACNS